MKKVTQMIIIGFAPRSSKILPNMVCKKFKHCAVIVRQGTTLMMYQFISRGHVEQISIKPRDINILRVHGWRFVYIPRDLPHSFPRASWTCVGLAKQAIRFHAPTILTPYALYKRICD